MSAIPALVLPRIKTFTVKTLVGAHASVEVGDSDVTGTGGGRREMVMLAVSEVALTKVVELTVIPVPEKVAAAPRRTRCR